MDSDAKLAASLALKDKAFRDDRIKREANDAKMAAAIAAGNEHPQVEDGT